MLILIEMKRFWQAVKFSNHSRLEIAFQILQESGSTDQSNQES